MLAIDTTGLQDTDGKDKYYLTKMANYVKNINSLNTIIIFWNFEVDVLCIYLQDILKI